MALLLKLPLMIMALKLKQGPRLEYKRNGRQRSPADNLGRHTVQLIQLIRYSNNVSSSTAALCGKPSGH